MNTKCSISRGVVTLHFRADYPLQMKLNKLLKGVHYPMTKLEKDTYALLPDISGIYWYFGYCYTDLFCAGEIRSYTDPTMIREYHD